MKKIAILLLLVVISAGALFAGEINLGNFPVGKWIDANYDAVWEFTTGKIRILTLDESEVYCDFSTKTTENLKVGAETGGVTLKFDCEETSKNYKFIKGLTTLTLEIRREGYPLYSVILNKK